MTIRSPFAAAVFVALAFFMSSNAAQASLIGDSIQITEYYPTLSTVYGSPTAPQTVTAGGVTFADVGLSEVSVIVTGSTITLQPLTDYTPSSAAFNGFDIHDLTSSPITGVSLGSGSLPLADLTFDGNDVFVNLAGVALFSDAPIVIDVATRVPEPITLSLFGAGLVGAAALGRRKRRTNRLGQSQK